MKLICFKNPADGIKTSTSISKEERAMQVTRNILANVGPHLSVKITHYPSGPSDDDSEPADAATGTAIRSGDGDSTDAEKWMVHSAKGSFDVTKKDLLDPNQYYVHPAENNLSAAEKRAVTARRKRALAHEVRRLEKEARKLCEGERERMRNGWLEYINGRIASGQPVDRITFDKMTDELGGKFSGEYLLRNGLTGKDENVRVHVHDDQASVMHMGVIGALSSVVTKMKDGSGGRRKRKGRDGDGEGSGSSEGRRNIVSTARGANMIEAFVKLSKDGSLTKADVSAAKKKRAARNLKECNDAVVAFDAFVASCTAAGKEEDAVTWKKSYFNPGRLDAKVGSSSANWYSDEDLKAILRLLFPESKKLSKPRQEKIAYIRDPKNFNMPWTQTSIDAELERWRHRLAELQVEAEDVAEQDEPEDGAEVDVAEQEDAAQQAQEQPQEGGLYM